MRERPHTTPTTSIVLQIFQRQAVMPIPCPPPQVVLGDEWKRPYSREKAAFPAPWVRAAKFWPTASRVDNVFGDRNLVTKLQENYHYSETPLAATA